MAIELKKVSKRVGAETHIYETSLTLEAGQFNILLGTTLSGKTSLMRLMAGLDKPSSGEVWFDGQNVTGIPVQKRSVAMVYQAFINYPNFTVFDNIASPLKVANVQQSEVNDRVRHLADLLKLTPMLKRMPSELSGGQQQRTALARALAKGADLVLLDEPLANLDYKLREELREELPKLFAGTGATVVYATSEPLEALMLGGFTSTLSAGHLIQFGETPFIYRNPSSLESAKVFSEPPINTAAVEKKGALMRLSENISWNVPDALSDAPDGRYTVGIRAYHLQPSGSGVKVSGDVQIAELSGSESIIRMIVEGNHWVSEAHGIHKYDVGTRADFYFDAEKCFYFDSQGRTVFTSRQEG
ncbi:MAG: ABC transporter ATP-binding protein [SAR324 cluster bacterium]|nr:ABC transporter ATP-binding protein [SAR324 cluster bacterium]